MSAFDYSRTAATAARLLARFGAAVTIKKVDDGTYNTATGQNVQAAPQQSTRNGALLDFPPGQANGPGGLVQGGDKRLLLEAGTFAPSLEDRVVANGTEYAVKGVQQVNPAGTPVIYDIHLRN